MGVVVSAGKAFIPAPAGVHQGVCCDIEDLGMVESTWQAKKTTKHKVRVYWQIAEVDAESGKPFLVTKRYTASLHEKSALRKDLQSWRGKPFTDDELRGFDLDMILGVNCLLNVVHNVRDGATYANIEAIMPVPKGTPKMAPRDYIRKKDRPEADEPQDFVPDDSDVPF